MEKSYLLEISRYAKKGCIALLLFCFFIAGNSLYGQSADYPHKRQHDFFHSHDDELDSIQRLWFGEGSMQGPRRFTDARLKKMVFAYHPYWVGGVYLNYEWDLLSDLCYFSYEVDPYSGHPLTTHDFLSSAAVDSARANGVRVHLCVTLFEQHEAFFNNPQSGQTLVDELDGYIEASEASGINIDFEAVPSYLGTAMNDYIVLLSDSLHARHPGLMISIAAPAVNWSEVFDIALLNQHIDFFMIMAYDYYWNGSSIAGPVDGLYSMMYSSNYSISRSLSYYQSQGVAAGKLLLGLPYYGRDWPVANAQAPSSTTGYGENITYRSVRINAQGWYDPENKAWEPNSFSPYYSYFYNDSWHHCFIDDVFSMGKRFDLAVYRQLAGIGIWALGYDNGFTDFWDLIYDKFCLQAFVQDTLFDSGGPVWDYYEDEDYGLCLTAPQGERLCLDFLEFELDDSFDTLSIYDGPDISASLIAAFTSQNSPEIIESSENTMFLRFSSDGIHNAGGWKAVCRLPTNAEDYEPGPEAIDIFPNPFHAGVFIDFSCYSGDEKGRILIYNAKGTLHTSINIKETNRAKTIYIPTGHWQPGVYLYQIRMGKYTASGKMVKD